MAAPNKRSMNPQQEQQEQYRSHLVEQFCPYVGKKVLGFVTHRFIPAGDGPFNEHFVQETVRADCLEEDHCSDLSCQRGMHPFR